MRKVNQQWNVYSFHKHTLNPNDLCSAGFVVVPLLKRNVSGTQQKTLVTALSSIAPHSQVTSFFRMRDLFALP